MITLEVVVHTPHCLKVVELLGGLSFTGGDFTRKDGRDEFLFEGDEETLAEAQRRLRAARVCRLRTARDRRGLKTRRQRKVAAGGPHEAFPG